MYLSFLIIKNNELFLGHISSLLIAAKVLMAQREQLKGAIKLIFQPAEEGYAGARVSHD